MSIDFDLSMRPDLDFIDGEFYAGDSRQAYQWMRANEPVFRDRNGLAGVATYRAVLEAMRHPELFSNTGGTRPDHEPTVPAMIDMDGPRHLRRRKLVNTGFTHGRVHNLTDSIRNLCDRLIDSVCEQGECDFVRDLARPLPMAVIGDMLGVLPGDHATLLTWVRRPDDHLDFQGVRWRHGGVAERFRRVQRVHAGHDCATPRGADRRFDQRAHPRSDRRREVDR
jgi:cholest-4-en-3-one 26-monooxygenase